MKITIAEHNPPAPGCAAIPVQLVLPVIILIVTVNGVIASRHGVAAGEFEGNAPSRNCCWPRSAAVTIVVGKMLVGFTATFTLAFGHAGIRRGDRADPRGGPAAVAGRPGP